MRRFSTSRLSGKRWLVALSALIIVFIETVEHKWAGEQFIEDNYLAEVIQYGLILFLTQRLVLLSTDRDAANSLAIAVKDERQNIAREIHDSIGQNISYLHIKLQYLLSTGTLDSKTTHELEQAQKAADEAYQQIRGTLFKLDVDHSGDLTTTLFNQVREICGRGNMTADCTTEGSSVVFALNTQLAIVYILREALINIEKHAHAQKVWINVIWTTDELTIRLSDNGHGFNTKALLPEAHFGLRMMQERAREINARFAIISQPGIGTEITLRVPIQQV